MTRYILTMTLDREPPGTDVTEHYKPAVLARLLEEGYVDTVDDEAEEPVGVDESEDADGTEGD